VSVSDEMYRRIVEAVPEGIWVVDTHGRTIFSNRRMAEILGTDFESMPEQSCFACVFPDELEDAQRHFARTLAGDSRPFDFRLRRGDGSPVWVSISCMPVSDDTGAVGLLGLFSDITERKQAEAALREGEQRFRNLADTAPVMIWLTGPDKLFTFFNKTWLDFTGRTMEQELGNGWADGIHPDDLIRCYETFCSSFDARRDFRVECRLRRADGEYRWMLCRGVPHFAPGGDFNGFIGSDIDITDLQSEERFRQLAENIDQIFWMLDLGTDKLLYVSPAFEKVWGCSSATLYQNRDWLVGSVHAEDRDRFAVFNEKQRSEPVEEFYRIVRPDASVRWIHDRAFLVSDSEGKPYRVAGIAEDITAHRELEEQLRQAHKMEAVGRLAGGIAHDFNNLLTVIGGHARLLLDGAQSGDPARDRLEQILYASDRATTLTRQLLAFSRRQPPQSKLVNVNRLLTNMEPLLRSVIGEHLSIETSLHPGVGCIKMDPHQLEQVVLNLAANARDAMPNGGRFRIETSIADATEMQADGGLGRVVRLKISDTGCGMDNRTRERAFEPFFTTKDVGKGTGLGLSIVYGIIRQNKGSIQLSSEPGQGTIFELSFPAVREGETETKPPADRLLKIEATGTVLLAEDEPAVRGLVRETLERLGYAVLEAKDGHEALTIIEENKTPIHLLLTDVVMPLMNGRELATRLESIRPDTKVLFMSGYMDSEFHGISELERDFIQKPFTAADLAKKLKEVLTADPRETQ
jgi:two-component system cell cycle sensor histidine kinase/response regulator CckA